MTISSQVAVIGASGQLGSWLCRLLGARALAFDLPEFDITDRAAAQRLLTALRPAAIINCAAYTAVDRAEREPEVCQAINATAVEHLADVASSLDSPLVQISTDYVFGATPSAPRPWGEDDVPEPRGVYAISKRAGELAAMRASRHLIVRTCGLYGHAVHPAEARNFVEAILAKAARGEPLRVVHDQRCSPSHTRDVAQAIIELVDLGAHGVFHVTNAGETTWFDFAQAILDLTEYQAMLSPISTAEYAAAAPRPAYSVLDCGKYAATVGRPLPSVRDALAGYLASRGILREPYER